MFVTYPLSLLSYVGTLRLYLRVRISQVRYCSPEQHTVGAVVYGGGPVSVGEAQVLKVDISAGGQVTCSPRLTLTALRAVVLVSVQRRMA